jgi:hypothetical protein
MEPPAGAGRRRGRENRFRAMVYYSRIALRALIPTVLVRLATEEGEVAFRARWRHSPLALQRAILFRLRSGRPLWFEDEAGRDLVFKPEMVWAAMVDGR